MRIRSRISFYMAKMCPCSQAEDVGKAHPRIVEAVETMVKKGKWTVPGEWLLQLAFTTDFCSLALKVTRRSSETFPSCKHRHVPSYHNRPRGRLTFLLPRQLPSALRRAQRCCNACEVYTSALICNKEHHRICSAGSEYAANMAHSETRDV